MTCVLKEGEIWAQIHTEEDNVKPKRDDGKFKPKMEA